MSDKFSAPTIEQLLQIILHDFRTGKEILNIPGKLIYHPDAHPYLVTEKFGKMLYNPVGLAAGPHTQLAQNIAAGWLCGARFIELKTVQTLDDLVVSKPCIDMQDEGYNCEWSQELKIKESYDQYLNAWILVHILNHHLFGTRKYTPPIGTIFDMSVGYTLEGIQNQNVQWFLEKMKDCSEEKNEKIEFLSKIYPEIKQISISDCISNSVTLSTMHGCPPREIEYIGKYLMVDKKLHTTIKLNPTLLGIDSVTAILQRQHGYDIEILKSTFKNDLSYPQAITIIESLQKTAADLGLEFGVKLSNTLECLNRKDVLPKREQKMYLSGKALHPITVNLAAKLQTKFDGRLNISFAGGADCFNITDLIHCGFNTVTVCSDLLKPGGYARLAQYFEHTSSTFRKSRSKNIRGFIVSSMKDTAPHLAALEYLKLYAINVLTQKAYHKSEIPGHSIKTRRDLTYFDCIYAPCTDTCPTEQEIPDYLWFTSQNDLPKAIRAILRTNPFPSVTGMICDHTCQLKCTRMNYDDPLLIREIKRYVAENSNGMVIRQEKITKSRGRVAIIGAGPSGLSCAWFLTLAGFEVEVFEEKEKTGGMVSGAIPGFRLTDAAIRKDIDRIINTGITVHYSTPVDKHKFEEIRKQFDYVYIAAGAKSSVRLDIENIDAEGVLQPLDFLFNVRDFKYPPLGKNIVIIGGGNTAMDAARTAYRIAGRQSSVTVLYRRTISDMPADKGEVKAALEEGITILELMSPKKVIVKNGKVAGLECVMMTFKGTDDSGRPKPVEIPKTEFILAFDTIIPAIGQRLDIDFIDPELLKTKQGSYLTGIENVFIGGDAWRGAATAVEAIGDGRRIAEEIIKRSGNGYSDYFPRKEKEINIEDLKLKKARREFAVKVESTPPENRRNFNLIVSPLTPVDAIKESARCLQCDVICNVCVGVCPNLANFAYEVIPGNMISYRVVVKKGVVKIKQTNGYSIDQKFQVLNLADWCNECGNCTTFCPTAGSPYKDKPRLYFSSDGFMEETRGFLLRDTGDGYRNLTMKNDGKVASVSETWDAYIFENEKCLAVIEKNELSLEHLEWFGANNTTADLDEIPLMITILNATRNLI